MNFRKASVLDKLMKGSEVPQPEWMYFLEVEKISPKSYLRMWEYVPQMDNIENYKSITEGIIPFGTEGNPIIITRRIKRTRNTKLINILSTCMQRAILGINVEFLEEDDPGAVVAQSIES